MNRDVEYPIIEPYRTDQAAIEFCDEFLGRTRRPRYVFGCNQWAQSVCEQVDIDGFVDDVIASNIFCGKPVIRSAHVPKTALVVSAVVLGRPLTAISHINKLGLVGLDYFAFRKYSQLPLKDVLCLAEFDHDFEVNRYRYQRLYGRLQDLESRAILRKLINFRLSRDLRFMEGFIDAQHRQYFEPFLALQAEGEVFVDVGGYDGATSLGFINRCPDYQAVHVFEPDIENMTRVHGSLERYKNIHFYHCGVSDQDQSLRFKSAGSGSRVSHDGDLLIQVKRIDEVILDPYSFLKIDIEGGELAALRGASETIIKYRPRLAVSVYHKHDDLWRISEQILQWHKGYRIFLRHYTEGVTETVMFFV